LLGPIPVAATQFTK
jgi:hypothetical protein